MHSAFAAQALNVQTQNKRTQKKLKTCNSLVTVQLLEFGGVGRGYNSSLHNTFPVFIVVIGISVSDVNIRHPLAIVPHHGIRDRFKTLPKSRIPNRRGFAVLFSVTFRADTNVNFTTPTAENFYEWRSELSVETSINQRVQK